MDLSISITIMRGLRFHNPIVNPTITRPSVHSYLPQMGYTWWTVAACSKERLLSAISPASCSSSHEWNTNAFYLAWLSMVMSLAEDLQHFCFLYYHSLSQYAVWQDIMQSVEMVCQNVSAFCISSKHHQNQIVTYSTNTWKCRKVIQNHTRYLSYSTIVIRSQNSMQSHLW